MSQIIEIVSWVSKSGAKDTFGLSLGFTEISQTVNRRTFDSEFRQQRVLSVFIAQIYVENKNCVETGALTVNERQSLTLYV